MGLDITLIEIDVACAVVMALAPARALPRRRRELRSKRRGCHSEETE